MALRPPSLTDMLPFVDFDFDTGAFLFEDGISRALMFELTPIPTSTRTDAYLLARRREIENAISSLPEQDTAPWVVQFFCNDDTELSGLIDRIREYVIEVNGGEHSPRAQQIRDSALTREVIAQLAVHVEQVSREKGLFVDDQISGEPWRGQMRRVRCAIYRRFPKGYDISREQEDLLEQLQLAAASMTNALGESGVSARRMDLVDFWSWLLPFFNPLPELVDSVRQLLDITALPSRDQLAPQFDLGEALFLHTPRSEPDTGIWWFGDRPMRAMALQSIRQQPEIGHFTAERRIADRELARFDRLPVGSMLSATFVVIPQDTMKARVGTTQMNSRAATREARDTHAEAEEVLAQMSQRDKLYPFYLTVFVRGTDAADLRKNVSVVQASLSNSGLKFIDPRHELIGCDVFVRALPMCFDPVFDAVHLKRSRLMFASQIASMLPLYGRARGTGNPGMFFWNRGGEPLLTDPLNKNDRKKNGHLLVLGPTGSGKSATLVWQCMLTMAIHRPRLVIVDAGKSFVLLGQFFAKHGLSVHTQHIAPGNNVSLPVFANAMRLLDADAAPTPAALEKIADEDVLDKGAEAEALEDGDGNERRDYLGEMVIQARLMITGGEPNEEARMSRADRYLIAQGILEAARRARETGQPHPLVEDVARCLMDMRSTDELGEARRARAEEMGQAMMVFCDGLRGEVFNRYGAESPDADVTIIELGTFALEGYEDALALAYTSLVNRVQAMAEAKHYEGRPTVFLTDEGHVITINPLLSPFLVKATKMWRKLGIWLWLATHNLEDFPDAASRMLAMFEWWLMLTMDTNDIDEIGRFRTLTDEQRKLMESATKAPPKYTEGVLLNASGQMLVRNVPPALPIALAMTEQHEKTERQAIMNERQCTELEAADLVAERLMRKRA